jgi:HSP20 family protein
MFEMTRWSPFSLHREMDDLFDRFFGVPRPATTSEGKPAAWWPAAESFVRDGNVCVRVALPGVDPKDVEVSVTDNVLTVKGERRATGEDKTGGYLLREMVYGAFERTMLLPDGIDAGKVMASYQNGMLEITLPAPLAVAPKKVDIRIDAPPAARPIKAA